MTKKIIIILAFVFSFQGFSQKEYLGDGPHSQLIIRGVMLINGDGSPPRGPMDIVVEGNKIVEVQKGYVFSNNSEDILVDLKKKTT